MRCNNSKENYVINIEPGVPVITTTSQKNSWSALVYKIKCVIMQYLEITRTRNVHGSRSLDLKFGNLPNWTTFFFILASEIDLTLIIKGFFWKKVHIWSKIIAVNIWWLYLERFEIFILVSETKLIFNVKDKF